ncbi:MAG: DUF6632 domain-containing protein, partial [Candidatus Sulfotelmatobacter sp.]
SASSCKERKHGPVSPHGNLTFIPARPNILSHLISHQGFHQEATMNRESVLKWVLVVVGLIFLLAVYPLMMYLWPSGWRWQPNQPEYEQMILGVYATLGVFLLLASRNPSANRSLIAFTAWSSLVHAAIMAVQAFQNASERGHLLGDIPALVIVGIVLIALAPARQSA